MSYYEPYEVNDVVCTFCGKRDDIDNMIVHPKNEVSIFHYYCNLDCAKNHAEQLFNNLTKGELYEQQKDTLVSIVEELYDEIDKENKSRSQQAINEGGTY